MSRKMFSREGNLTSVFGDNALSCTFCPALHILGNCRDDFAELGFVINDGDLLRVTSAIYLLRNVPSAYYPTGIFEFVGRVSFRVRKPKVSLWLMCLQGA